MITSVFNNDPLAWAKQKLLFVADNMLKKGGQYVGIFIIIIILIIFKKFYMLCDKSILI